MKTIYAVKIRLDHLYIAQIPVVKETEVVREKEFGRPFSCVSSTPKYNAEYLERIVKTKWLKKLEELKNAYKI